MRFRTALLMIFVLLLALGVGLVVKALTVWRRLEPDDENVFHRNTFYYGVDDRFAVGYGDPRTAIKIVDS